MTHAHLKAGDMKTSLHPNRSIETGYNPKIQISSASDYHFVYGDNSAMVGNLSQFLISNPIPADMIEDRPHIDAKNQ